MKKAIVAASTALLLGSLTPVFAETPGKDAASATQKTEETRRHGPRFSAEDRAAFAAARLAALKAGLQLTSEQETHWSGLETALREIGEERKERFAERRESREERGRPDALQVLTRQAEGLRARADSIEKVSQAAKPLYDSLDDNQKRRFGILLRDAFGGNFGPDHGPRDHRHHR